MLSFELWAAIEALDLDASVAVYFQPLPSPLRPFQSSDHLCLCLNSPHNPISPSNRLTSVVSNNLVRSVGRISRPTASDLFDFKPIANCTKAETSSSKRTQIPNRLRARFEPNCIWYFAGNQRANSRLQPSRLIITNACCLQSQYDDVDTSRPQLRRIQHSYYPLPLSNRHPKPKPVAIHF